MEEMAAQTLDGLSVRTVKSIRQQVASLSGGQRQTVAIAKAVLWNSKVVILDEPTAALGVAQTAQVLELVRRLADKGLAVVLISHNMNDVFAVSDRIAALYLGRMAAQVSTSDVTHSQVVELITSGRSGDLGLATQRSHRMTAAVAPRSRNCHAVPVPEEERSGRTASLRSVARNYVDRVRGGEMGALPAVLGLIVLCVFFAALRPVFLSERNFANLFTQGAAQSPPSPWAWSSCSSSARSTCRRGSPAGSAPRSSRSCSPTRDGPGTSRSARRSSPAWSSAWCSACSSRSSASRRSW